MYQPTIWDRVVVIRFDEQWKLKTLANTTSSISTPVQGFAWWLQCHLADGMINNNHALALWALRN